MRISGTARRLRIYIGDADQWQQQPLWQALLELLRREGLAGATVLHGVAGFGAHSRIHTRGLLDLSTDLPVVVEVIDRADRIARVLPRLEAMVNEGLITEEEVTVHVYRHRALRPLTGRLLVRDLMTREVTAVSPAAPLAEVVGQLTGRLFRALPVVDADRRVLGIITSDDLIGRGGLPARLGLVGPGALPAGSAATARDIMTPHPVTVAEDAPAAEALHRLAEHALKRLPVVDAGGRLVGMLSRVDLLRAVADGYTELAGEPDRPPVHTASVRAIMDPAPALVRPATPVPEVLDVLLAAPTRHVFVADEDDHVVGVISDADLVAQLDTAQQPDVLGRLAGRAPGDRPLQALSGRQASDIMREEVVAIEAEATLEEAIRRSLDRRRHVLPVVDAAGRVVGQVSRAEMLAALATPGRPA